MEIGRRKGRHRPTGAPARELPDQARRQVAAHREGRLHPLAVTDIKFFTHVDQRLPFACKWTKKAVEAGRRLVVYAPEPGRAEQFDRLLWTFSQLSFVPHVPAGHALAAETPVVIAASDEESLLPPPSMRDTLLNLSDAVPPWFASFAALREIVSAGGEDRPLGRERYKHYQSLGYTVASENRAGK
ncbi:MAG: DNA polymerase III subunit chi [Betaproteobacteria bacterium]|nr:DNA polymerase III subunit chi [Betaproteobacteria bacterium]